MDERIVLRGLAWNHTRGFLPMVAAAQRFEDLSERVYITWEKRSLQSFGDAGLDQAAKEFDLLVIDHPYVGQFAASPTVIALEEQLPIEFLDDLSYQSVGKSFESYWFNGHLWAVPIDTAAPVSSSRHDLFLNAGLKLPECWEDIYGLAKRGLVVVPATPVDSLMNFYMLCCGLGQEPFEQAGRLVSRETGIDALHFLRQLVSLCRPECLFRNPIETYRVMVTGPDAIYCPFAFGYSNYSRAGYAPAKLTFGGLVTLNGMPLRSTLGGAGLAISSHSSNQELALEFLQYVASGLCQQSLYYSAGGQPAHRSAWTDARVNADCGQFFLNTLPVVEAASLRPRHNGYLKFQQEAGLLIHAFLKQGGSEKDTFAKLEDCV